MFKPKNLHKNMNTNMNTNTNVLLVELEDYMFTSKNINRYTKHMIQNIIEPKSSTKNITPEQINKEQINKEQINKEPINKEPINKEQINKSVFKEKKRETMYKPKQKDSLFWCFYILKNGFFNYEMEINNQYFVVEKNEKFKYIELFRKNKDILKIHKIKPLTELEDDLANKDKISIKTFVALCVVENINILLVNNRKIYELLFDEKHQINVVHRNNKTYEHSIELDTTNEIIQKYRDTYYTMSNFETTLKSMGSYKLDELIELCKKLNINIDFEKDEQKGRQKMTKKDIYNLLVLNY
jgi:hypothetical protein